MWLERTTVQNRFTYVIQRLNMDKIRPYAAPAIVILTVSSVAVFGGSMDDDTADNARRLMDTSQRIGSISHASYVAADVTGDVDAGLARQVSAEAENGSNGSGPAHVIAADEESLTNVSSITTDSVSYEDITEYTVGEDETVESIAHQFSIAPETIRWANDLTENEEVSEGDTLTVLPMNGVLHEVESDDTPQSLAERYEATADYIVSVNDAEVEGLQSGEEILIPGGVLPESERPQAEPTHTEFSSPATGSSTFTATTITPRATGGNTYPYGQCTWYAKNRRPDIPNMMGNAGQWLYTAQSHGMPTGNTPKAGAIAVDQSGFYGHVGYVEEVRGDTVIVSDMNYGWTGQVTKNRQTHVSEWSGYIY